MTPNVDVPSRIHVCSMTEVTAVFVTAYDQIVNGPLADFIALTNQIGGDAKKQVRDGQGFETLLHDTPGLNSQSVLRNDVTLYALAC